MDEKEKLSSGIKAAIGRYLFKVVLLPGLVVIAFILGVFITEVAQTRAKALAEEALEEAKATFKETKELKEKVSTISKSLSKLETFARSPGLVQGVTKELKTDSEFQDSLRSGVVRACRICFKETEGSSQCQGSRNTCSGWSYPNSTATVAWTRRFRDDTDNRDGGCWYQWKVQCEGYQ